jgi:hypothetical protein
LIVLKYHASWHFLQFCEASVHPEQSQFFRESIIDAWIMPPSGVGARAAVRGRDEVSGEGANLMSNFPAHTLVQVLILHHRHRTYRRPVGNGLKNAG